MPDKTDGHNRAQKTKIREIRRQYKSEEKKKNTTQKSPFAFCQSLFLILLPFSALPYSLSQPWMHHVLGPMSLNNHDGRSLFFVLSSPIFSLSFFVLSWYYLVVVLYVFIFIFVLVLVFFFVLTLGSFV